eukprot:TRINITY_DN5973_c0_g1_i1.p1 TRINITY_DN5973_c0_g1~~TRINITY_DN5973_c0_g1_i1.p1  ORF type:complete len:114 (-),score=24.59 TRINITY_DN5973_c0_g1_i1:109-450(-)
MGRSRSRSRSRGGGGTKSKRDRSRSDSGTPDWLKQRRKRAQNGELKVREDFSGKGKGDKGKGGGKSMKPGDWECPKCGGMVFASKSSCFKCGASKPSGGGGDRRGDSRGRGRR